MIEKEYLKKHYAKILAGMLKSAGRTGDKTGGQTSLISNLDYYRKKSNLKSAGYFYDRFLEHFSEKNTQDIKTVGYLCNLVPEEIILAAGLQPARLCSETQESAKSAEECLSADTCPLVKSTFSDILEKTKKGELSSVIIPAACDGKIKLAELLSGSLDIYFLDLPRNTDYKENADVWEEKYRDFKRFLEKNYKKKIARKDLLEACLLTNKRTSVFRKIYDLRLENEDAINVFDYFIMCQVSFFDDIKEWTGHAELFYAEANNASPFDKGGFTAESKQNQTARPRILLSGSPVMFPNFKLLDILDSSGFDVAADTLCSGFGRLYDPVVVDEDTEEGLVRGISLKYMARSLCPCLLGIDKLLDNILDTVAVHKLDGVIYHNLRLCQVFDIQTSLVRQVAKEKGIPFLSIKTDFGKEDTGQLKTRLEAFKEIL